MEYLSFQFLAIMSKATMNILVSVFGMHMKSAVCVMYPKIELLG